MPFKKKKVVETDKEKVRAVVKTDEERVKAVFKAANLAKKLGRFFILSDKSENPKVLALDSKSASNAWKKAAHSIL